jgi:hypothetical protein
MLKSTIDFMQPKRRRAGDFIFRDPANSLPGLVFSSFCCLLSFLRRMPAMRGDLAAPYILITKA